MKKLYVLFFLFLSCNFLQAQTTETFETETQGSTTFTDNGKTFTITSQAQGPFYIQGNYLGTGWNGTSSDNRYIDNDGFATFNMPVQFTVSTSDASLFTLKSMYLFLSTSTLNLNVSGSVTITGKLSGATQFTASGNSPFNTSMGVNNGFTFFDISTFGGQNNSLTLIDQFVITTTGNIAYVALDALRWQASTCPSISSTGSQTNVTCNGGANGTATVVPSGGTAPYTYSWSPSGGTGATITGRPAGNYTVTITDANGCTGTRTFTITQPPAFSVSTAKTDVSCFGGANGAAAVSVSGGTGPYTYSWSPSGGTNSVATGLAAGSYTITITDANSCQTTRNFTINQPASPISGSTIVTNIPCNGGNTGAINLTPTGGTGPYTFNWGGGITTEDRTGLSAGNYSVTITDANGCTGTVNVTVNQPASAISGTTVVTNVACNGGNTGAINLTPTGGTGPYTFDWGGGITTEDRTGLSAGNYSVTIRDANGCTGTVNVTVNQPAAAVSGTTVITNVACFGGSNGSINLTPTGGTAPYTYNWGGGVTTQDRIALPAGTYSVVITDFNNCSTTISNIAVTQPLSSLSGSTAVTNVACNGGNTGAINLTPTGGTGPYTFVWSDGPTTEDRTDLLAGSYSVMITDANGCTFTVSGITVTQPSILSATTSQTNATCTSLGEASVTPFGGTAPYTYLWTTGATTQTANALPAGNHSVTITDNKGCTLIRNFTITTTNTLTAAQSQSNILCNGTNTGSATVVPSGAPGPFTYVWSPSGGNAATASNLEAGNYSVLITSSNGCAITRNFTITQPPVLSASTTQNNVTTFGGNNGTATVTAIGGTGGYTYSWAPSGGAGATATGLTAGTYTVTITDANLCQITRNVVIRQPTGINSVSVPVATTYKIGDALDFTVNFSEAVTVTGTPNLNLTIGTAAVSANYLSGSGSSALTFRYTIPAGLLDTDGIVLGNIALNGGTITDALSTAAVLNLNNPGNTSGVLVDAIVPTVSISSNPSVLKKGETSIVTFTFNKSPGSSFTWNGSVGDITISGGSLSAISGSGLVYTAIFTPTDNVNVGSASISVNAGSYTDAIGNLGNTGTSPSIAYDTQAPSTSITSSALSNDSGIAGDFITNISSQTIIGSLSASLLTGESVWVSVNNGISFINTTATTGDITFGLNTTLVGTNTIQIKVMDAAGNSGTVYTKNYVFDNLAPNIPTNLLVSAGNQENILNWTPNTETDLVFYRVFGGISNNPTTLLQDVSIPNTSYTHTSLTNGTTYYYKIIAVDVAGNESAESTIVNATPQAPQVISFAALPVKVYGDADFSPGATASSNLTITYTSSNTNVATIINGNIHIVGQGTTTITALQNGNSAFLAANPQVQTLTVNKKVINVSAEAKSKTYGDADPALTYTFSPSLVIGDSFSGSLNRVAGENVGTYSINQGSLTLSNNYTLNYTSSNLSINPKIINVSAEAKSKTYGDADPALTFTFSPSLVISDSFSGSLNRVAGENVGTYSINQGSLALSNNYSLNYTSSNLSISPKIINVSAEAKTKTYRDTDPALTYTFSPSLLTGDSFSGSLSRVAGENVGNYTITQGSLGLSNNYTLNYTFNNLQITRKSLTIIADNKEKFEGEANPVLTISYTGFVGGENNTVLTTQPSISTTATVSSLQGTYPITVSGAVAENYAISYQNGVLTVKPGAPTSVSLAGVTLYENRPIGTLAGTLSSTSNSPVATFTYSLVGGTGATDNASFVISGNQLRTAASLNYENKQSYSIRVRSTTQFGFSLDQIFTVNLSDVNEAPTINALNNQTICYTTAEQVIALSGITAGPEAGQTTTVTASGSNSSLLSNLSIVNNQLRYRVASGQSGSTTITIRVRDNGGVANGGVDETTTTFNLIVNALPQITIISDKGQSISKGETVQLTAAGGTSYQWSNVAGIINGQNTATLTVRPLETTTYTVLVTNGNGCQSSASITIEVREDFQAINAENFITPNGDGINDKWVVENIDAYPNHTLIIFDRAGRVLYETRNYQNNWDGTFNGALLTSGTYYYVFQFEQDNIAPKKGFISIIRSEQ